MASPVTLTRLAFRPLSTRIQCRFASGDATATTATRSATGLLAGQILKSLDRNGRYNAPKPAARTSVAAPGTARGSVREMERFSRSKAEQERADAQVAEVNRVELERMQGRKWAVGDVYAPHDLTHIEQKRWRTPRTPGRRTVDVFDELGINPILEYKNFALMAEYVSETGRIKPRSQTGLRPVNQRRIAKAIRRAAGCGLMPRTYKHPELLLRDRLMGRRVRIAQERSSFGF